MKRRSIEEFDASSDECVAQKRAKNEQTGIHDDNIEDNYDGYNDTVPLTILKLPTEILMKILARENIGIWNVPFVCLTCKLFNDVVYSFGGKKYWLEWLDAKYTNDPLDSIATIVEKNLNILDRGTNLSINYFFHIMKYLKNKKKPKILTYVQAYGFAVGDFKLVSMGRLDDRLIDAMVKLSFLYKQEDMIRWVFMGCWTSYYSTTMKKKADYLAVLSVKYGNFSMLKWLRQNGARLNKNTCEEAAKNGNFHMLKWLRQNGACWDQGTCAWAAHAGNFEMLKWCRDNGARWDLRCASYAAENGHIEILKWLRDNKAPFQHNIVTFTISMGQLEVLKWLGDIGMHFDATCCIFAAENGHFEVLKWLHENGVPWNEYTCAHAARNGHFEILKWCIENGAPWDNWTLDFSREKGHFGIVKWLQENLKQKK